MSTDSAPTGAIITIERFILEQQQYHPDATGALTDIPDGVSRRLSPAAPRAALVGILGNIRKIRRDRQKLDSFASAPSTASTITRDGCRHGLGGRRAHYPHPRPLSRRQVRAGLRPAGRLIQHRLQRQHRHNLRHLPAQVAGRHARHAGGLSAKRTRPRGRGLCHLRIQHHARLLNRSGRPRLYAGPHNRRVPAYPPQHPHPGQVKVLQRQPGQRPPLVRLHSGIFALAARGEHSASCRALHRLLVAGFTQSLAAASSTIRRTQRTRPSPKANCACSTRLRRFPSWRSRRAVTAPTARSPSSICSRTACTSACRSSSAAATWCKKRKSSSAPTTHSRDSSTR